MDIEELSEKFGDKMAEMKAYLEGGGSSMVKE